MTALATQFRRLPFFFAVLAAVLPVGAAAFNLALAGWMRALFCHGRHLLATLYA